MAPRGVQTPWPKLYSPPRIATRDSAARGRVVGRSVFCREQGQLRPGAVEITTVDIGIEGPPILGTGVMHQHPAVAEEKRITCGEVWLIFEWGPALGANDAEPGQKNHTSHSDCAQYFQLLSSQNSEFPGYPLTWMAGPSRGMPGTRAEFSEFTIEREIAIWKFCRPKSFWQATRGM